MDIFDEIARMKQEFDRAFSRIFSEKALSFKTQRKFRTPAVDIREKGNNIIANFEIPGIEKENIDLNVTNNSIEVSAKRKLEKEVKRKNLYSYEARAANFYRKVPLPSEVDSSKATAVYKNGILRVVVPKKQTPKKKIKIN